MAVRRSRFVSLFGRLPVEGRRILIARRVEAIRTVTIRTMVLMTAVVADGCRPGCGRRRRTSRRTVDVASGKRTRKRKGLA